MILGLQLIGVLFAAIMLYFTFLNFKRNDFQKIDFVVWVVVWVFFLFMVMFPRTLYGIMENLHIKRTVDFFVIGGFLFFSIVIFHLYTTTIKTKKKIGDVVRKIALEKENDEKRIRQSTD